MGVIKKVLFLSLLLFSTVCFGPQKRSGEYIYTQNSLKRKAVRLNDLRLFALERVGYPGTRKGSYVF